MATYIFYLPIIFLLIPLTALVKLAQSSKKLNWQTDRLKEMLDVFKNLNHEASKIRPKFKSTELNEAFIGRNKFKSVQAKNKADKQRRLVKRLRGLTSKESE